MRKIKYFIACQCCEKKQSKRPIRFICTFCEDNLYYCRKCVIHYPGGKQFVCKSCFADGHDDCDFCEETMDNDVENYNTKSWASSISFDEKDNKCHVCDKVDWCLCHSYEMKNDNGYFYFDEYCNLRHEKN